MSFETEVTAIGNMGPAHELPWPMELVTCAALFFLRHRCIVGERFSFWMATQLGTPEILNEHIDTDTDSDTDTYMDTDMDALGMQNNLHNGIEAATSKYMIARRKDECAPDPLRLFRFVCGLCDAIACAVFFAAVRDLQRCIPETVTLGRISGCTAAWSYGLRINIKPPKNPPLPFE